MRSIIQNKKAYFQYNISDKYTAGIQLMGTEVKSIREAKASIGEAFCIITNNEVYLIGMHISEYKQIKHTNHEPIRDRKLLLKKNEIKKLGKATKEAGLTIVPLSVLITNTGFIKIEIGVGKGKKTVDKRESIKEKDIKREMDRNEK